MARGRTMGPRPRRTLYALLVATPAVFGYAHGKDLIAAAVDAPAAAQTPRPPKVTVAKALRREIVHLVAVSGSIVPREEMLVGPQIEGVRIAEILADVGDRVGKGDVLARLDRRALDVLAAQNAAEQAKARAEIAQSRALLAQAQASEIEAAAALGRARTLERSGNVTAETLQTRDTAHKVAVARAAAQREALAVAEASADLVAARGQEIALKLDHAEVVAPDAGVISSRSASVGQIAMTADPLFRIIRNGAVEFAAEIPENSLHLVAAGHKASVSLTGKPDPLAGRVRLVTPTIDVGSRLGLAKVTLPGSDSLLSGRFATASIEAGRREGVVVPRTAVSFGSTRPTVLVVSGGRVSVREVSVGLPDGDDLEILDGLAPGESLVARAAGLLRDGDPVTPASTDAAASLALRLESAN